jgi:hypothetical protein
MNNGKMVIKLLILSKLLKTDDSSNLRATTRLRNLIVCCVGLKMAAQGTIVPFRFHFHSALLTTIPTLRNFVNNAV